MKINFLNLEIYWIVVKYKEDLYWEGDEVSTHRLNIGIQGYIKSRLTVIHECLVYCKLDGVEIRLW